MVTISLVVYNNSERMLERLLTSIQFIEADYVLLVVDNSPTDRLRFFFTNYPKIDYFFFNKNLGFGKGHNYALRKARLYHPKYHLIINPDVHFTKDPINELIRFLSADRSVGLVAPKMLYDDDQFQYSGRLLPSPISMILRRIPIIKEVVNKREELHELDYNKTTFSVPFLLGCFMFLPFHVLESINGFDERYFMYLEDVDLCRTVRKKGYKVAYYPRVEIKHSYAKSSTSSVKLLRYHIISMIKYFNKWGWFDDERRVLNSNILKEIIAYTSKR